MLEILEHLVSLGRYQDPAVEKEHYEKTNINGSQNSAMKNLYKKYRQEQRNSKYKFLDVVS